MNKLLHSPYLQWTTLIFVLFILYSIGHLPMWYESLHGDVVVHYDQVNEYLQSGSWSNIPYKEYQPGALWSFLIPNLMRNITPNLDAYIGATILVNIILIIAHFLIYQRFGPPNSTLIFLAILIAMGPILLFRFDLTVTLFAVSAWLLFTHNRTVLAGLALGIGISVKLYPIVLAPIMIAEYIRQKQLRSSLKFIAAVIVGGALLTIPYLAWSGTIGDIVASLNLQKVKPVNFESIWGNALTFIWDIKYGQRPTLDLTSIPGINAQSALLPMAFYNYFWVVPVSIATILLFLRHKRAAPADSFSPLMILLVFLLSYKLIGAQYLWWFLAFLPLLDTSQYKQEWRWAILPTVTAILILTQIVFPIKYTSLIAWYHNTHSNPDVFLLTVGRNLLLILLIIVLVTTRRHSFPTKQAATSKT